MFLTFNNMEGETSVAVERLTRLYLGSSEGKGKGTGKIKGKIVLSTP